MLNQSTSHRMFNINEILGLICNFSQKQDLASLVSVSQRFFHCSAPQIWYEVPGVQPLIGLLLSLGNVSIRQLHQPLLLRFNTYAALVKRVELDLNYNQDSLGLKWLLTWVPQRPLLPNLQHLDLPILRGKQIDSFLMIQFTEALLCPALVGVRFSGSYIPWLNPLYVSKMLQNIVAKSPDIQSLQIFAGSKTFPEDLTQIGPVFKGDMFGPIIFLQHLRVITSGGAVLDSAVLQLLGELPHLESIVVLTLSHCHKEDHEEPYDVDDLSLVSDSFPALKHLMLMRVPSSVISKLWQTPPLVQRLESIQVTFDSEDEATLSNLFCAFCRGSPQVKELRLDFEESGDYQLSEEVIESLRQSSLQRICLYEAGIAPTSSAFKSFVLALPKAEYIEMSAMSLNSDELVAIAKHMPKLEFLAIFDITEDILDELDQNNISPSPSKLCLAGRYNFSDSFPPESLEDLDGDLDFMAKNLHALWPRGVRCELLESMFDMFEDDDEKRLQGLNARLKGLGCPEDSALPSIERCLSSWLYPR